MLSLHSGPTGYHVIYPVGWQARASNNHIELVTKPLAAWQGIAVVANEDHLPVTLVDGLGVSQQRTYKYEFARPVAKEAATKENDEVFVTLVLPFQQTDVTATIDL